MNKGRGLIEKLKSIKHIEIIIAIIALAIMLCIYFYSSGDNKSNSSAKGTSTDYCTKIQSDIEQLISKIKGAGEAKVVIGWESDYEGIAENERGNGNSNTYFGSFDSDTESSIRNVPKARSAVIVCQGGENASVKISIIMAVSKLLNISTDNVLVYSMKK